MSSLPGTNSVHASGTEVTVIANPIDGYQFSEWAGDCTGSDPCVVTMDDNKSVAANFVRLFTLTAQANPPAGGTVSPDSTTSHIAGSKITVVANPTEGYQFRSGAVTAPAEALVSSPWMRTSR